MNEMIFRGNLKDFLESKKIDILRMIRFGISNVHELYDFFKINTPSVNFDNLLNIIRIDNDKLDQSYYILKFPITGDTFVLDYKPSITFISMPEWIIKDQEIWFCIEEEDLETTKNKIDGIISNFKNHLIDIATDIAVYNNTLEVEIQKLLNIHNNKIVDKNIKLEEIRNHIMFGA